MFSHAPHGRMGPTVAEELRRDVRFALTFKVGKSRRPLTDGERDQTVELEGRTRGTMGRFAYRQENESRAAECLQSGARLLLDPVRALHLPTYMASERGNKSEP
jgi:hypothetical protein